MKSPALFSPFAQLLWLFALAMALTAGSCGTSTPCGGPYTGAVPFPVSTLGYGAGATLDPAQYNKVSLRRGDFVKLVFNCPSIALGSISPGLQVVPSANAGMTTMTITVLPTALEDALLSASFYIPSTNSTSNYDFKVVVARDVWPGDANADGRRNLHDLMPIAWGIRNGILGPTVGTPLPYPPSPMQMNNFYSVGNWSGSVMLWGKSINLKHADCNLDGKIDTEDIEYLLAVLGPVAPPTFQVDTINGLSILATYDASAGLEAIVTEDGEFGLRVPFDISLAGPSSFSQSIFGVSFTRPVSKSTAYRVVQTRFKFVSPDIWGGTAPNDFMLWEQKFWNQIDIAHKGEGCANTIDNPLDVGIYKKLGPLPTLPGSASARCGNCQVTLLDVLTPSAGTPPSLTLNQQLLNGITYTLNGNGLSATALECSGDSTKVDLGSFCGRIVPHLLIRDWLTAGMDIPSSAEKGWSSPDIWVRTNSDSTLAHQDPMPGQLARIYVRVLNPTCTPIAGGVLRVYATHGALHHQGADFGLVGTVNLPSIPGWGNVIRSVPWTVPAGVLSGDPKPAYSLLATVDSPLQTAPNLGAAPNLADLVVQNTHVAMRTGRVQTPNGTPPSIEFALPSAFASLPATLTIQQVGGSTSHPASSYGSLKLVFTGCSASPAFSMNSMPIPSGATSAYSLVTTATIGQLSLSSPNPGARLSISFTPMSSPASTLTYRFVLTLKVGSIEYPGQAFELQLP